ncbi:MAG: putative baseplate assembly protein [Thermoanaerobaculia bacterium]
MIPARTLLLDPRRARELVAAILARRPGYLDRWRPPERGPGRALIEIDSRYLGAVLERLNQAPDKNKLAFLELLGVRLIAAEVARAPIVFQLGDKATDTRAPAGTRVAAPPPPEGSSPIVFETERGLGLSAASIRQVVSLWPGRDQYIDHTEALLAGEAFRPFRRDELEDTPHHLYLAHEALLELSGTARVEVEFELSQPGSEQLDVAWEYWDGEVWRTFRSQRPECAELGSDKIDATNGLTASGRLRLETDCAGSAKKEVNGIETFWIRGRLDEPLPPDPSQILPEVSQLRLSTVIEQPLDVQLVGVKEEFASGPPQVTCKFLDGDGAGIPEVLVELVGVGAARQSQSDGTVFPFTLPSANAASYTLAISIFDVSFERVIQYAPTPGAGEDSLELELTLQLGGLQPDSAFANAEEIDLTRPFYPLGQHPQPGSTFFFRVDEAFSKPGAQVKLHLRSTTTPQDNLNVVGGGAPKGELPHTLTWQYWNGRQWLPVPSLSSSSTGPPEDFTDSGDIAFTVPPDFAAREVEGTEGYWLRARLVSGAYGFTQEVSWADDSVSPTVTNTFTYVIPQPPALADLRVSYTWEQGPFHAEHVLAYNDFAFADRTEQAQWPGSPFQPYHHLADTVPALYLGFDRKLPVDRLGLFFDAVEMETGERAPELEWEYWAGFRWRALATEDGTQRLLHPGIVSFIGARDAESRPRFGEDLHWLRARQKEDGPPAEPEILALHTNAVWASQWQTTVNETAGTSSGQPSQRFSLRNIPVLEGERLQIRELLGPRAEVEWRSLAEEVLAADAVRLRDLESLLAQEGPQTDIEAEGLRLRRDRNKRVTEVWIDWQPRPHLRASTPEDRHYVLDRGTGIVLFGDGDRGRVPPLGADVLAREYRSGGGSTGNVAQGTIEQMLAGIPGVDAAFNPRPAEGGADEETLASVRHRGPRSLRHRGRALLPADYEVMAKEASPAVAVARAKAGRDPDGRHRPGWVTLVIIPRSEEPRPAPSFGLREKVRRHIEERTDATLAAATGLRVVGPDYLPIEVEATVVPAETDAAGEVAEAARGALATFLHPLAGGPDGSGWPAGRDLHLSDLCAALERARGVDYVSTVKLFKESRLMDESVPVPDEKVVVAGDIRINVEEA